MMMLISGIAMAIAMAAIAIGGTYLVIGIPMFIMAFLWLITKGRFNFWKWYIGIIIVGFIVVFCTIQFY